MAASNYDLDDSTIRKRKRDSCQIAMMESNDTMTSSQATPTCYKIVSLRQWLNGWHVDSIDADNVAGESKKMLPIVDLRSYDDFDKRHLSIAKSENGKHDGEEDVPIVNLPLSTLISGERSCELPPRHVEFAILIPRQFIQIFQEEKEDCSIHELFFASRSKSTLQSRKPWLVRQVLLEDDDLWKEASEFGCVRFTNHKESSADSDEKKLARFRRLPRLWKPDPLVCSDILPMLKDWILDKHHLSSAENLAYAEISNASANTIGNKIGCLDRENSVGLVLDLGSGAGRDICYLAEELKEFQHSLPQYPNQHTRSIQFVGIDNHKGSAKRCLPLWKNHGVDDITNSFMLDLKKLHTVRDHFMDASKLLQTQESMPRAEILCLFAIRYLNRKLLSYIANSHHDSGEVQHITIQPQAPMAKQKNTKQSSLPPPSLVLPLGTIVAISHFCKSEKGASWNFDHPKEANVLDRWELSNMFGNANKGPKDKQCWEILKNDLVSDGDHGRTLVQFVVKKVA